MKELKFGFLLPLMMRGSEVQFPVKVTEPKYAHLRNIIFQSDKLHTVI